MSSGEAVGALTEDAGSVTARGDGRSECRYDAEVWAVGSEIAGERGACEKSAHDGLRWLEEG